MLLLFVGGVASFGAMAHEPDAEPELQARGNRFVGRNRLQDELRNLDAEETGLHDRIAEIAARRREIHDLQRAQGLVEIIKSKNLLSDRTFINDPNFTVNKQRLIALCILAMAGFQREDILSYLTTLKDGASKQLRDRGVDFSYIPRAVQAVELSFGKLTEVQSTQTDRFYDEAKGFVESLDKSSIRYYSAESKWEEIKRLLQRQVGFL